MMVSSTIVGTSASATKWSAEGGALHLLNSVASLIDSVISDCLVQASHGVTALTQQAGHTTGIPIPWEPALRNSTLATDYKEEVTAADNPSANACFSKRGGSCEYASLYDVHESSVYLKDSRRYQWFRFYANNATARSTENDVYPFDQIPMTPPEVEPFEDHFGDDFVKARGM